MANRRSALAFLAATPFLTGTGQSPSWRSIGDLGSDVYGTWENRATGHVVDISSRGIKVCHRLDEFWIQDPGLVPSFSLYAMQGETLQLMQYDYRAAPILMQAPVTLTRTQLAPPAILLSQADTLPSRTVFNLICRSFDRYYPFFTERRVDWSSVGRVAETTVQDDISLFDTLAGMLRLLGDGHVNLSRGERTFNAGRSVLRDRLTQEWRASGSLGTEGAFVSNWAQSIKASAISVLDPGTYQSGANDALEWGCIGKVGYLRINRFSGFAAGAAPRHEQIAALGHALLESEKSFTNTTHLIVDVVQNGGGNDAAALFIANHFADRRRKAVTYQCKGVSDQAVYLDPIRPYPRPITLLTSEITASAAEIFVLMMRACSHVRHAGEATRGILSSMLPKPFPNGFMATMAYQRVFGAEGKLFEPIGIPPTFDVQLFPQGDLVKAYPLSIRRLAEAANSVS